MIRIITLLIVFTAAVYTTQGQKADTAKAIPVKDFRNVIKFNPTPMMLWHSSNVTFSYERILGPKQSLTTGLGFLVFNPLIQDTIADVFKIGSRNKYGLNASFEYRFYMTRRNSRPIPDGLYLAPFFSTYLYHFENGIYNINNNNGDIIDLTGDFYAFNIGGALGYQFVFWKRVTLDLILIGPALSYYGGKLNIRGDIDLEGIKEINEDVYNKIIEKYPQIDGVLIDETFTKKGTIDFLSVGYRYVMQIGFVF
jgi:hypothetical protein